MVLQFSPEFIDIAVRMRNEDGNFKIPTNEEALIRTFTMNVDRLLNMGNPNFRLASNGNTRLPMVHIALADISDLVPGFEVVTYMVSEGPHDNISPACIGNATLETEFGERSGLWLYSTYPLDSSSAESDDNQAKSVVACRIDDMELCVYGIEDQLHEFVAPDIKKLIAV